MAAGSIVVDLLMRTGSFETDTGRAEKRLRAFERQVAATTQGVIGAFGKVGAAIAGAVGIGSVQQFAASVINELDALNDVADATGATVETISALESVALRTGATLDTVSASLLKFNQVLSQAGAGSEAAEVLKAIGLNAEELKRLDPAEALRRTSVALAQFADDGNKARAVQVLFGRSVAEVAPFLKDLAGQTKLVGTVTTEQAEAAARFNKSLSELRGQVTDLSRDLAGPLVDGLNRAAKSFKDSEAAGDGFYRRIVKGQLALLGIGQADAPNPRIASGTVQQPPSLALPNQELTKYLEGLQKQLDLTKRLSNEQKAQADIASGALGILTEAQKQQVLGAAKALDAASSRDAPRPTRIASVGPSQSEAERYLESLQKQLERMQDLTVTEQTLADIQAGRLGKVTSAQQAALVGAAEQIDAVKRMEEAERENAKAIEESARAYEQLKAAGQQVYEATRTPLEQLGAEQARLNELLQKGAIDWDTYSRAVFNAQDAFDATTARAAQAGDELSQFARTAAANIQTTLGDSLFAAMNGRFNDIGAAFTQMLNRMVAEALAAKLTEALLGSAGAGGGTSGSGGLIQAIGSFFGGAKASGGDVIGGRSYLVGEEGPEMFVPRTTGLILPANQPQAAGGRNTTINNSFTVSGQVDRRTQEQIAADAGRAIQRALARGVA